MIEISRAITVYGATTAMLILAGQASGQDVRASPPPKIAIVADINSGLTFPPATVTPGVLVTLPRSATTALEFLVSARLGSGGIFYREPGTRGVSGEFWVQLKRIHGDGSGNVRVFHTFGLLGGFGPDRTECCIELDRSGNVISDTTRTSFGVLQPILPFAGFGFDRKLGRGVQLRVEGEAGVFVWRATIGLAVPIRRNL
jgi:hypothetical protein